MSFEHHLGSATDEIGLGGPDRHLGIAAGRMDPTQVLWIMAVAALSSSGQGALHPISMRSRWLKTLSRGEKLHVANHGARCRHRGR